MDSPPEGSSPLLVHSKNGLSKNGPAKNSPAKKSLSKYSSG